MSEAHSAKSEKKFDRASTLYNRQTPKSGLAACCPCFAGAVASPPRKREPLPDGGPVVPLEKLAGCKKWNEIAEKHRAQAAFVQIESATKEHPGWQNQDRAIAAAPSIGGGDGGAPLWMLFGVLDGHGNHGHEVSEMVMQRVPRHLAGHSEVLSHSHKALEVAVITADNDVHVMMKSDAEYSGTTGCFVFLNTVSGTLTCANVGDSRAVLARKVGDTWESHWLSTDHKPDLEQERERIEMSGGVVAKVRAKDGREVGTHRVWESNALEKPGLAVSRSIGDACGRSIGVVATPTFQTHQLQENDKFLIIGSDGLWDCVSPDAAIHDTAKWLRNTSLRLEMSTSLATKSLIKKVREEEGGILEDDTTIVIVVLDPTNNASPG